jgi:hypothetical protein
MERHAQCLIFAVAGDAQATPGFAAIEIANEAYEAPQTDAAPGKVGSSTNSSDHERNVRQDRMTTC